jgi:hypothetical protein
MRHNKESYSPTGELEIWKLYADGKTELHFSDANQIVSGMGVVLSNLFAASGSDRATDYQIRWFQVGTSGFNPTIATYQLGSSLPYAANYGESGDIQVSTLNQIVNGGLATNRAFVKISDNNILRVAKNSIQYVLYLGPNNANNLPSYLNEVGLFVHNIKKQATPAPILVAYKYFSPIEKLIDFALVFKWTITF